MAEIEVWNVSDLLRIVREEDAGPSDWIESVRALGVRAHARGDGIAIYVNQDLGHPDLGEWQVCSYGGNESQIVLPATDVYPPVQMPDIGGRINWRYCLRAVVPSYDQKG